MEAADHNIQRLKLKGNTEPLSVSDVRRDSKHRSGSSGRSGTHGESGSDYICFFCGSNTHNSHQCQYKETVCHTCGKKGHLAKVCRSL